MSSEIYVTYESLVQRIYIYIVFQKIDKVRFEFQYYTVWLYWADDNQNKRRLIAFSNNTSSMHYFIVQ
jgi:hypothetical protein